MSAERCELTDLLVDQCSHCRGLDAVPDFADAPIIQARFEGGECPECSHPIEAGQMITRGDDWWLHAECAE